MNSPLHLIKIKILTKLIKENAISMEEALIFLKEEESVDNHDYLLDSSYWTANLTNSVIHFDDGTISN
jgi:hypothetical protein